MLLEVEERQTYISGSGYRCKVLSKAQHGQDCSVSMIVYTNLDPTFDSPVGKKNVGPRRILFLTTVQCIH